MDLVSDKSGIQHNIDYGIRIVELFTRVLHFRQIRPNAPLGFVDHFADAE
jgi:hypothetical protein